MSRCVDLPPGSSGGPVRVVVVGPDGRSLGSGSAGVTEAIPLPAGLITSPEEDRPETSSRKRKVEVNSYMYNPFQYDQNGYWLAFNPA
eukprot:scaffold112596_cov26-Prasinocladus_malaysianus.AAC.1